MSGMNEFLQQYYNTGGAETTVAETVSTEDLQKQAQVELFAKIAEENGVDISQLPEEAVVELWDEFQKQASDSTTDKVAEEDKDEKKDDAAKELAEKKAMAEKVAEVDALGRIMAHAYVDELSKIAAAADGEEKEAGLKDVAGKVGLGAGLAGQKAKYEAGRAAGKAKDMAGAAGAKAKNMAGAAGLGAAMAGAKAKHEAGKAFGKAKGLAGAAAEKVKAHKKEIGIGAGGAAAGAAAGYAAGKKKESSAIDALAVETAVKVAFDAGFDIDEAAERLDAVLTLGPLESQKVASAGNVEQAVEIRALELLEMAGYPVTWSE